MSVLPHYNYETLTQLKGQAVKDLWHSMIGKPPGLKNTTGLRNNEEILQAILKAQDDPTFSAKFMGKEARPTRAFEGQARPTRAPKQLLEVPPDMKEVPPKPTERKKPGPKPKLKPVVPPVVASVSPVRIGAIESTEIPIVPSEVQKIHLRKLHVGDASYFLNPKTKQLYAVVDGKPGAAFGTWNAETRTVHPS